MNTDFVDWDPFFFRLPDEEPGEDGLVWLYDAEGESLVRVRPEQADVVAAALEYAYADVAAIFGTMWGRLENREVARLLRRHAGQHPHVGASSVLP